MVPFWHSDQLHMTPRSETIRYSALGHSSLSMEWPFLEVITSQIIVNGSSPYPLDCSGSLQRTGCNASGPHVPVKENFVSSQIYNLLREIKPFVPGVVSSN